MVWPSSGFVKSILRFASDAVRLVAARRLWELDAAAGGAPLLELLATADVPLIRSEALDALVVRSGDDYGFDPWDDPGSGTNQEALDRLKRWASEHAR